MALKLEVGVNGVFGRSKFRFWGGPPKLMHLYMNIEKKMKKMKISHFWRLAPPKTAPRRGNLKIAILKPFFMKISGNKSISPLIWEFFLSFLVYVIHICYFYHVLAFFCQNLFFGLFLDQKCQHACRQKMAVFCYFALFRILRAAV